MTLSPERAPKTAGTRRLTRTLYASAFCDEFVLLYPVYALLFSDTGLSVWQMSSLFALWSLTGVLLEVPSGVWADAFSRRLLLVLGPLLTAAGFALWVLVPSYGAFAVGFVLWGAGGALGSGALEALVYDELDRAGAADRYARVMGRARAVGITATMAAMGLAGPVFAWGGYDAVGAASVLVCLAGAAVATRFPEHRAPSAAGDRWTTTLRAGLTEARTDRSVRGALLLVPAVTAVWGALDEYTPLLAADTGVAQETVPWLLLVIWAGATAGGLLAGAAERLTTTGFAVLLAGSALALSAGAALGTAPALVLVALAFGGFQLATVLADARLQRRIDDTGRATLTSVAGLGTELGTLATYGAYAATATVTGHGTAFVWSAVPYLLTAVLLAAAARTTAAAARARPRSRRSPS
ncbi:MFS transporter [Streptomyces mutabilis]|uniref:MFS transporter n=1 Tax=Streptomyces TaxID=1883 RepID=UPI000BD31AE9|nr:MULTISPECIES: MFS transporter [unclassified Streptomyces]MDN3248886.1 MFS transporter [Streptomyces sp. ZSW22]MDN3257261.1 MFS transporter [Streptomyces sp. MA25(2023)]MDQ0388914.1 MFS family permease [Streptomyces sp. DSM 42143]PAK27567.1 MFS transporter [Streptomyces sp. alain-838]